MVTLERLPHSRIVYIGCGLAGKETSLASALTRNGQAVPPVLNAGEHRFVLTRSKMPLVELDVSISSTRAWLAAYDATDPQCNPRIHEEIERLVAADGLVFVLDSERDRQEANFLHVAKLKRDLALHSVDAGRKPIVFQANKRDLADVVSMDWIRENFQAERCAYVESVATQQSGTMEAMREVLRLTGAIDLGTPYRDGANRKHLTDDE